MLPDFQESLNILTDSQYTERVLHIETDELIQDDSKLTIQLQQMIKNRCYPLYITYIRSHTGLPGHLGQGNNQIDQLLMGSV